VKQRLKRGNRLKACTTSSKSRKSPANFRPWVARARVKSKIDSVYWQWPPRSSACIGSAIYPGRSKRSWKLHWAINTSAISPFSNRSSIIGPSPALSHHAYSSPDRGPERQRHIVDITCDSDGKVSKSSTCWMFETPCPFIELIPAKSIYLGVFMVGAFRISWATCTTVWTRYRSTRLSRPDEESGWYIEE